MKRRFILVCVILALPAFLKSEMLRLRDGSAINGRLLRMQGDTLYFRTSFGTLLAVHRSGVAGVDFDSMSTAARVLENARTSAEAGTLVVDFEDFQLTSRIAVERGGDRGLYAGRNAIEERILVGNRAACSFIDSTTDKTIREGPKTVLRNDIEPKDCRVALAPGLYRCSIVFFNPHASALPAAFEPSPLEKKLVVDPVRIEAGQATTIRVGLKRKWPGKSELVRRD